MFSNCECDLMAAEMSNLSLSDMFFHAPNAPKLVFGRVSAPDPAAGAYDAPPDSLSAGEGTTSPNTLTQSTPSASRYGASVVRPPMNAWQRLLLLEIMAS